MKKRILIVIALTYISGMIIGFAFGVSYSQKQESKHSTLAAPSGLHVVEIP